jgi:hypothetical protein
MKNRIYSSGITSFSQKYNNWDSGSIELQKLADKSIQAMRLERKSKKVKNHEISIWYTCTTNFSSKKNKG